MAFGLRRAWFLRLAVGVAAVAFSVLGAASAQAAVGGALPLTSTFRPDLRSVTLVSDTVAQFCFDKSLNAASIAAANPADFSLGGYHSGSNSFTSDVSATTASSATLDDSNPACVDVVFPSTTNPNQPNLSSSTGSADLNQYTIGSVAANTVFTNQHAEGNDADSTALTGSTTHNGTTGNTVTPDLTGVVVQSSFNSVQYVFNKNIGGVNTTLGKGFFIIDSAGDVCRQTDPAFISFSGNVVTVGFPIVGTPPDCPAFTSFPKAVNAAVRAGLDQLVVSNATSNGFHNVDSQVSIVPGSSGTTGLADLMSAVVSGDGSHIAYTFDKPIGSANSSNFGVALADGGVQFGTGTATITNTATTGTVNVAFASGSQFNEYDVKAFVAPGAATVLNEATGNTFGSVPVGDNAGAFARGFTTGPDATAVTFNSTTGQAVITFDQRVDLTSGSAGNLGGFVLLDQDGTPVAGATPTGASGVPSAAGPVQVTVDFPPAAFTVAKALEICGRPDDSFGTPAECPASAGLAKPAVVMQMNNATVFSSFQHDPNVQQIISPFASSAVLSSGSRAHWKHATRISRRAFARQLAAAQRRHAHRAHRRTRSRRHSR